MFDINMKNDKTVKISGYFDAAQVEKAEEILNTINGDLSIDCSELEYISSAGIGILLATYKRLHDNKFSLQLVNLNEYIKKVLKYAGMTEIFNIKNS